MKQTLSGRQQEMVQYLLMQSGPVTTLVLAEHFGVSRRTVRYDLDAIGHWLDENQLALIRKPRYGVCISGSDTLKRLALEKLFSSTRDHYLYPYKREERVRYIVFQLLQETDRVLIDDLTQNLGVSRGTVLADLDLAEKELARYGITLERIPGYGLKLRADEFQWRRAAAAFLIQDQEPEQIRVLLQQVFHRNVYRGRLDPAIHCQLQKWFSPHLLHKIETILGQVEEKYNLTLTERAFYGLVVHISLAIMRLQEGKDIVMPPQELSKLYCQESLQIAKHLTRLLEDYFQIAIPEGETGYLALHIMGAKRLESAVVNDGGTAADGFPVAEYVEQMIRIVSETLNVPLLADTELRHGLSIHLTPTLIRLKFGLPIDNPVLPLIRQQYPQIFAAAQRAAIWLGKEIGVTVPLSEIGYLAMHFGAAVIRLKDGVIRPKRILFVCASGVGTATLLKSVLRQELPDVEWMDTVSAKEVTDLVRHHPVDLIISTLDSSHLNLAVPVVSIDPLPTKQQIYELKERIYLHYNDSRNRKSSVSIHGLMDVINRFAHIFDREGLYQALETWFDPGNKANDLLHLFARGKDLLMLDDLLTKGNIRVQQQFDTWEQVVDAGAGILYEQGYITKAYINKIKQNHKEHGPYMVIAPGVVLLHARPEDGANDVCISLMTLKEPVAFGHPQNDPVDIVITFASLDNESHVQALSQMMALLSDEASVEKLRSAREEITVQEIIRPFVHKGGE